MDRKAYVFSALTSILTFLSFSGSAMADNTTIRMEDNSIGINAGGNRLYYNETSSGSTLDSERGWQPTFGAELTLLGSDKNTNLLQDLYFHLAAQYAIGSTKYDGALYDITTQVSTPYESTTNDRIFTINAQLGHAFSGGDFMFTPLIDLGYRDWSRQLTGIGAYSELYQNGDFMGGGLLQYSPGKTGLVFSLIGEGGLTFGAQVTGLGSTDPLQSEAIWHLGGKIGWSFLPRWEISTQLDYTDFRYGESPVNSAGYYEPDSHTQDVTALVGITYEFTAPSSNPLHTHTYQ